jgi:hypothetical protein
MKRFLALVLAALLTACPLPAAVSAAGGGNFFAEMDTVDINFAAFDASVFAKRLTVLCLWSSWCGVFIEKIPDLEVIRKEYAGRVNVVSVLLNAVSSQGDAINEDALEIARKTLKAKDAAFPTIIATPELYAMMNGLNVTVVPTTWFISSGGSILYMAAGALDAGMYRQILDDILR